MKEFNRHNGAGKDMASAQLRNIVVIDSVVIAFCTVSHFSAFSVGSDLSQSSCKQKVASKWYLASPFTVYVRLRLTTAKQSFMFVEWTLFRRMFAGSWL